MKSRLLLSTPLGTPGPLAALKNHKTILSSYYDVDVISLEDIISPSWLKSSRQKRFVYRICKSMKNVLSVAKIVPYGENIIFGTFHPIHYGIIEKLNRIGIRPSFMWCSTLGQMEFTPHEMGLFMRLVEYLKKGKIRHLFLHRRLFDSMGVFVKEAKLLPHSIDLIPYRDIQKIDIPGMHIDLFCRTRLGKNVLNQIAAFKLANVDATLHINFNTRQFKGIVEEIGADIVQHKWIPAGEYLGLVAAMTLSLQVTVGESFNYAVCERMCLGVPVLTTKDIYLVADDAFLSENLCIESPDTPSVIAGAMSRIAHDKKLRREIADRSRIRITEVARQNNKIVRDQILQCFR